MSKKEYYFLVDKDQAQVLYFGELPESWGNIPSVNTLSYETLKDLAWANYPHYGFLNETDARAVAPANQVYQAILNDYRTQICDAVWLDIKADRDERKAGGVKLNVDGKDYWFWTDEPSRTQYSMLDSMVRRNNLPATFVLDNWKTMTGEKVQFTVALLYRVIDSGIANEKIIFNVAENHKAAMYASLNPAGYDYSGNYPQSYEEFLKAQASN